jgi:hypothetical protein
MIPMTKNNQSPIAPLGVRNNCNNAVSDRFGCWFISAERQDGVHVDLYMNFNLSGEKEITVTKEAAKILMAERNKLIDALSEMANCFDQVDPDAFGRFWYGKSYPKNS